MSARVKKLRALAADRGATKAEAAAAKAKADELDQSEQAIEILKRLKFSEEQARGIVEALPDFPIYRPSRPRWGLFWDWCSANHHRDPMSLEAQLRFMHHDLNGVFGQGVGGPLNITTTAGAAEQAFRPYADLISKT